jgi:hypothetical protein
MVSAERPPIIERSETASDVSVGFGHSSVRNRSAITSIAFAARSRVRRGIDIKADNFPELLSEFPGEEQADAAQAVLGLDRNVVATPDRSCFNKTRKQLRNQSDFGHYGFGQLANLLRG